MTGVLMARAALGQQAHLSASASPTTLAKSGTGTLTTNPATTTATGGNPPYSYAWTLSGVSGGTITIGAPASPASTFTSNPMGGTVSGTAICTVTDSSSNQATASVNLVFSAPD